VCTRRTGRWAKARGGRSWLVNFCDLLTLASFFTTQDSSGAVLNSVFLLVLFLILTWPELKLSSKYQLDNRKPRR
jgi:hypothetical protein